ncbi:MAG: hypothetical protein ACE5LU_07070 [Anaerolineae bacterium]
MRRWRPWVLGVIAALYVSRVGIEFAPPGRPVQIHDTPSDSP